MHIDHSKLVELLAEATGLKEESVQKNLLDLVDEIKAAIRDGDAYEVDGFGVFSGIGDNIIFIPSDDLATEINYKYAGMEPLIMDEVQDEEEVPDTAGDETEEMAVEEEEDPFGGLLEDEDEEDEEEVSTSFELDIPEKSEESEETEEAEEKPGPDQWGIDTYRDDDDENMFSGLLGDSGEEEEDESELEDDLSSIFDEEEAEDLDEEEEEEDDDDLAATLSKQLSGEDEFEDLDTEDEDLLGAFMGEEDSAEEKPEEPLSEEETSVSEEEEEDEEEADEETLLDSLEAPEEEALETEDSEISEDEDFDDPFEALAASGEEEEEQGDTESVLEGDDVVSKEKSTGDQINDLLNEKEDEDEVIPVIKNLASDAPKKKEKPEETEEEKPVSSKKKSKKREAQAPPVLLWVLLIIMVLGGGIYGLGYFNVIHIPGVSSATQIASTQQPATPAEPQSNNAQAQQPTTAEAQTPQESVAEPVSESSQQTQSTEPETEQPDQTEVPQNEVIPAGQDMYGLRGVPVAEANNGFTIVVFSLSNENNARTKQRELANNGYRALMAAVPSQQYGTLWRVSIGQFASQRNAALAAEGLESPYSENYFITRIR